MNTINREHFEAWLFSQPRTRAFNYDDVKGGCAVCSFIRETTDWAEACGGSDAGVHKSRGTALMETIPLPDWMKVQTKGVLWALEPISSTITIGQMQDRYRELFPDACTEPEPKTTPCPTPQATT